MRLDFHYQQLQRTGNVSFSAERFCMSSLPSVASTQMCVERCQSPSRCTNDRALENPAGVPSALSTSNRSSESTPADADMLANRQVLTRCRWCRSERNAGDEAKATRTILLFQMAAGLWLVTNHTSALISARILCWRYVFLFLLVLADCLKSAAHCLRGSQTM